MLSEQRIKLMTRLASYEATEAKKNTSVARHFRSDYVSLQVIKAILCATIAYLIAFAGYIYYDFEGFMVRIYKIDLWAFAASVLKYYVVFTVAYCVIVYIVFTAKYGKAKKSLKRYFNTLKVLGKMYKEEEAGDDAEEIE